MYAWAARRSPGVQYNRRCLTLSDGGLISLDFAADPASEAKVCVALCYRSCILLPLVRQSSQWAELDGLTLFPSTALLLCKKGMLNRSLATFGKQTGEAK